MKLLQPICPECGDLARGTVEVLHGCALLTFEPGPDGPAEYAGETDIWWEEQRGVYDLTDPSKVRLICHEAHEWDSAVEYEEPTAPPTFSDTRACP